MTAKNDIAEISPLPAGEIVPEDPVVGSRETKVAVILINWNGLQDTLECLASLSRLDYRYVTVILVDNNSDDDPSSVLEDYPDVHLIRNRENLGFCRANNQGIELASEMGCEYCWILNNDTEVAPDSLRRMVAELEGSERIGAVTNRIDYAYDRNLSWFMGGIFRKGLPAHRGWFEFTDDEGHGGETEYLSGCSFLARTSVLRALGAFDENYFCYVEDVDLSLRIKQAGYELGYAHDAIVWHKVSRSTENLSAIKLYYKHRNMLYLLNKVNAPFASKMRWWMVSLRRIAAALIKHRDFNLANAVVRALVDGVRGKTGYTELSLLKSRKSR